VSTLNHNKIRELRTQKGVTILNMASDIGMSESNLNQIELGMKIPNANALKAVADFLGVSVDSLYTDYKAKAS
jgi:transcriptional regulator with XRE-family HTH domain